MVDIVLYVNPGLVSATRWKRYAWDGIPGKGETINILGLEESGKYPIIRLQIEHVDHMFDEGYVAIQSWVKVDKDKKVYDDLVCADPSWKLLSEEVPSSPMNLLKFNEERRRIGK